MPASVRPTSTLGVRIQFFLIYKTAILMKVHPLCHDVPIHPSLPFYFLKQGVKLTKGTVAKTIILRHFHIIANKWIKWFY